MQNIVYCTYCCEKNEVDDSEKTAFCGCCGKKYTIFTDPKKQIKLIKKMAWRRIATAQYYLGTFYEKGEGVEQDTVRAYQCYLVASKNGHKEAQRCLSACYRDGVGVKVDLKRAETWAKKADLNVGSAVALQDKGLDKPADEIEDLSFGKMDAMLDELLSNSTNNQDEIDREFNQTFMQEETRQENDLVSVNDTQHDAPPIQEPVREKMAEQEKIAPQMEIVTQEKEIETNKDTPTKEENDMKKVEKAYEVAKLMLQLQEMETKMAKLRTSIENIVDKFL